MTILTNRDLGSSINNSDEPSQQYKELVQMQAQSESYKFRAKVRDLRHSTEISKKGNHYKAVVLDYMVIPSKNPRWLCRKKPIGTDEAATLIRQGPSDVYEITAEKDSNGYASWVSINKVEI